MVTKNPGFSKLLQHGIAILPREAMKSPVYSRLTVVIELGLVYRHNLRSVCCSFLERNFHGKAVNKCT